MTAKLLVLLAFAVAPPVAGCEMPQNAAQIVAAAIAEANAQRRAADLPELAPNERLAAAAQDQACWLAETGRFSHDGRGGSELGQRLQSAGYAMRFAAESIARGAVPEQVMGTWMRSLGHRENILSPRAEEIGIGVARGADGVPTWVLVLGRGLEDG